MVVCRRHRQIHNTRFFVYLSMVEDINFYDKFWFVCQIELVISLVIFENGSAEAV